jgi:hypothetical protein
MICLLSLELRPVERFYTNFLTILYDVPTAGRLALTKL